MNKIISNLLIIIFFIKLEYSNAQNIQVIGSSGPGIETGGKMVQDANGNIYCFGIFTDTLQLNANLMAVSSGNFDCYIAKFNRYMQPIWVKTIGGSGAEGAGGIAYDDGKLYLGGWYGAQTIINNDTLIYNFDCISPGFIASIDTSGNFIHAKAFTKNSNSISCFVNAIEVNQTGLVIAGKIKGQFEFGNGQNINTYLTGTEHDIFVARFDTAFNCNYAYSAGSVLGSQRGDDGATCLQIDTLGNIYLGGFFGSLPGLGNATLYFGNQTVNANGGYGFTDYFIVKIRPNGYIAWLRSSGGSLPDYLADICLDNDARLAITGRYSDNSNIAGVPLPASIDNYSTFFGSIDSAGTGLSAHRVSNEADFQALKKGMDNYFYAADYNFTGVASRFKIYKLQIDTGVIAVDSLLINTAGSYNYGDILPPAIGCNELIFNSSFNSILVFQGDTLISNNYQQNLYDFCYGKYSMSGTLLSTPQINSPSTSVYCSNTFDIHLSVSNIANANEYHWYVFPSNAGSITINANEAILNIDSTFSGEVKLVCYASNFCDISNISDTLSLTIHQSPIIYSIEDTGFGAVESNVINATNFNWYLDNVLLNFANMNIINCIGDGVYTIIANNANCSDKLSNYVSCIISNIKNLDNDIVNIFPNPAKNNFTINSNIDEYKVVKIFSMTGQLLYSNNFLEQSFVINTETFAKGFYTVQVKSNSLNVNTKLMVD
ncbi:MAG TPA: T9SS type A sorting domain-containing protein [Bacteroidia bacterium]|nr:T9SS type A sorting domain-containing protein [Bacteroidia bacterium]